MTEAELRRAIIEPALHAQSTVDRDLVEMLLRDLGPRGSTVAHDPGALPLLSHALAATWEASQGRGLTVTGYLGSGAIAGGVQQTAERLYGELSSGEQDLARRVFTRLVNVDEDNSVLTRRRLDSGGLPTPEAGSSLERVLHLFIENRLITAHEDSIEISHEALLTAWSRLRNWLDADRETLRLQRSISDAARIWQQHDQDPTLLLRGARLAAAVDLDEQQGELSPLEREYISRSRDAARAEHIRDRGRLRLTRQLLTAVAVLAIVALASTGASLHANAVANRDRRTAVNAEHAALSRQVAIEARELTSTDPALAEQLALIAWRTSPTVEARSALLDQSTAPLITRVLGGPGPTMLALSPNGQIAAVGHGDDGSVHLYQLKTGVVPRLLGVIPGTHGTQVFALAFSGPWMAVGGTSGQVQLWNIADPQHPQQLAKLAPGFKGAVESIAVSPDGGTLAAVSAGPSPVRLWNVSIPSSPQPLPAPAGVSNTASEQSVVFSPDGSTLISVGSGGTGYAWNTHAYSTPARTFTAGTGIADAAIFDRTGQRLVTADRDGVIRTWNAATLKLTHTLHITTNSWVNTLALSPDGTQLAAGSSDNTLMSWNTATWNVVQNMQNPGPVTGVAYAPDGHTILTTATDGALRLWTTGASMTADPGTAVFSVSYSHDGKTVATADEGTAGAAHLWDVSNPVHPTTDGKALTVAGADGTVALQMEGSLAAVGSSTGRVQLWDIREPGKPVAVGPPVNAAHDLIESLAFSPDGKILAVGSDDKSAHLWNVSNPARPRQISTVSATNFVFSVAFNPRSDLLAAASADNNVYLWSLSNPSEPRLLTKLGGFSSYAYAVAISPNDKLMAATSADGATRLWSIKDPAHPTPLGGPLTGPTGYNLSVAFSPDNSLLAIASNDHDVWLYNIEKTDKPSVYAELNALGSGVNAVAFSPNGQQLAAGGRATSVPIWADDPNAFGRELCTAAGAPITKAEWERYVPGSRYTPPCA